MPRADSLPAQKPGWLGSLESDRPIEQQGRVRQRLPTAVGKAGRDADAAAAQARAPGIQLKRPPVAGPRDFVCRHPMDLAGFILELELHRLCGQPAEPRPAEERVAVGYRAPIEGKIRLQAMSASQERYAAHANAHAGMGGALRWLQAEAGPAVANLGADGMGEPFLSQEHLQRLDRSGQFADEFERGTAAHPARRLQLRQHHGVRGRLRPASHPPPRRMSSEPDRGCVAHHPPFASADRRGREAPVRPNPARRSIAASAMLRRGRDPRTTSNARRWARAPRLHRAWRGRPDRSGELLPGRSPFSVRAAPRRVGAQDLRLRRPEDGDPTCGARR